MPDQLNNYGEEFCQKLIWASDQISRPANLEVLLYDDSTDNLGDGDDLNAISTEPTDGNYQRQQIAFDSSSFTVQADGSGNWEAEMLDVVFDVINSTGDVDGYAVLANFQSEEAGDSSANDHVIMTGSLDQSYPLSKSDRITTQNGGSVMD